MMRRIGAVAVMSAAGLLACRPDDPSRPPTVRLGQDACAQCRMIISDSRFAAATVSESGESLRFDDVGCLIQHASEGPSPSAIYWVRSYIADQWLDAQKATFVQSRSIASPMGFGLAAVPAAGAWELQRESAGRTLGFTELPDYLSSINRGSPEPVTGTR